MRSSVLLVLTISALIVFQVSAFTAFTHSMQTTQVAALPQQSESKRISNLHSTSSQRNDEVHKTSHQIDEHVIPAKNDSRRSFFKQTATSLVTVVSMPVAVHAQPSTISQIQSPFQDVIAPGHWIGGLLPLNSATVTWKFPNASPQQVSDAFVKVLNDLTPERLSRMCMPNFEIAEATSKHIHVLTWTKKEWLDTLDVSLTATGSDTIVKASFYATGFLPTSIPAAPILNIALFFFPFASPGPGEMLQVFRLRVLEGLLSKELSQ